MDSETVKIKACIKENGNGLFPSDTNIVTHNGVPLRDKLLKIEKGMAEFSENEDGSIKLIFDDGK